MSKEHPRSSRQRYRRFVLDYRRGQLAEVLEAKRDSQLPGGALGSASGNGAKQAQRSPNRRQYLRDYVRWLLPHRAAVSVVFAFALLAGGLEMVQPLFMRFIVDRVLLKSGLE